MAMIDTARAAPLGSVTIYRVVTAVSALADRAKGRAAYALSEFTPAHLEDIGLSAADYVAPEAPQPSLRTRIGAWLESARTADMMSRMSQRHLDDIGVSRTDIAGLRGDRFNF